MLGAMSLVAGLFDRSGRAAHRCARLWARLILLVSGTSVEVRGTLPQAGTYVFVSNHQSLFDIPILFRSIPRELRVIAKDSLGSVPFLGWHLRRNGHLLVDRRKPGAGILKRMRRLVAEHASLIAFPEGTRSYDGRLGRFKRGVFLLAIEHGLPIVPVTLDGSRHVMTRGRLTVRPGRVILTIHEPVPTSALARDDARALAGRVRAIVESGLATMTSTPASDPSSPRAVPAADTRARPR
ncbi:MAG: lysophospholipid acyltransferase family protein [Vicinamibacterales bacterium]